MQRRQKVAEQKNNRNFGKFLNFLYGICKMFDSGNRGFSFGLKFILYKLVKVIQG